jgi:subtilase family serine protease
MRTKAYLVGAVALVAGIATTTMVTGTAGAAPGRAPTPTVARACANAAPGYASCMAWVRTDIAPLKANAVSPNALPAGLGPADLRSAYALTTTGSATQTIAIVDAQNDPTAEQDMATYRSTFGLPACTTANGCFRKVDQNGGQNFPATDSGWALEISLDLDMASAICPACKILLVEGTSASFANLAAAVNRAATLGANVISNSYGGSEAGGTGSVAAAYSHAGVAITASSGDSGFAGGISFPASGTAVISVGGTTLTKASNTRGWTESAWNGAGSGCSRTFAQPTGQASVGTGCARKAVSDISAVADPNTGVAVFDSTPIQGQSGFFIVGGTSASAPIIASMIALAGNSSSVTVNSIYTHTASLNDVTTGNNGRCRTTQQCTARAGWDGPTGLGTPNGLGAL